MEMGTSAQALLIARQEFLRLARGWQALGVWVVFLLTYLPAVSQAHGFRVLPQFATVARAFEAMSAFDLFLVPFAGLLLGYAALAGEVELGTIAFLASRPLSRPAIVLGKFLGRGLYLGLVWLLVSLGAAVWVGAAVRALRAGAGVPATLPQLLGDVGGAVLYPISLLLLALSFLAIGLLLSAWASRATVALSLGFAAYALLGIGWNALFPAGPSPRPGRIVLRLLSPFVAWLEGANALLGRPAAWKLHLLEQGPAAWAFLAREAFSLGVILLWIVGGVALAAWRFGRRDLT